MPYPLGSSAACPRLSGCNTSNSSSATPTPSSSSALATSTKPLTTTPRPVAEELQHNPDVQADGQRHPRPPRRRPLPQHRWPRRQAGWQRPPRGHLRTDGRSGSEVKGIVPRDVVRVVTAGTVTADASLDSAAPNYLGAIAVRGNDRALALADITTGRGPPRYRRRRGRSNSPAPHPAELLVEDANDATGDSAGTVIRPQLSDTAADAELARQFGDQRPRHDGHEPRRGSRPGTHPRLSARDLCRGPRDAPARPAA